MTIIAKLREKWRNARISRSIGASVAATPLSPPQIFTEHGVVTEWARAQAAQNMRDDVVIRQAVETMLIRKLGSEEAGMAEARRRYPEAYAEREAD